MSRKRPRHEDTLAYLFPKIASQWDEEKNGDLKPEDVKPESRQKVWWKCAVNDCGFGCIHSWNSIIGERVKGRGCPHCTNKFPIPCLHKSLKYLFPDIANQWDEEKNGDLKPEHVRPGSDKQVWWKCPVNDCGFGCVHSWNAIVDSRRRGNGCPHCANKVQKPCIHKSLKYLHPDLSTQWDLEKNGNLKPEDVTPGSNKKVWWKCPVDDCGFGCIHSWNSSISHRSKGSGCPHCSNQVTNLCFHKSLAYLYPKIAKQWDAEKNGELKPEDVTPGCGKNVWWVCEINDCGFGCIHSWKTSISHRTSGKGCPYCSSKGSTPKFCIHKSLKYLYPNLSEQWDNEKNGELKPEDFTPGSTAKVWWKCKVDSCGYECIHSWNASIDSRARGRGCPYCSTPIKKYCVHRSFKTTHPHIALEWDDEKNGDLKPEDFTSGSHEKCWWKCNIMNCQNQWMSTINSRVYMKCGCPKCNRSKMELNVELTLEKLETETFMWKIQNRIFNNRQVISPLELDVYLQVISNDQSSFVRIEMDGIQHFQPVERFGGDAALISNKERDSRKTKMCEEKNIHLLRIGYDVKHELYHEILIKFFNQIINEPSKWHFVCEGNVYQD